MATKTDTKLEGRFNWDTPSVVPAFVQGEDAKAVYDAVSQTVRSFANYDESTQTMIGSSLPIAARIDTIVRPFGIRVATLADLSRPEVMAKIKDRHYSDTPALIARTASDSHAPNAQILEGLVPYMESSQGTLRLPALVTGFDVQPANNKYGWEIVPRDDFAVVQDERLEAKYNGKTFSSVDEQGLPLFDKKGSRTWYARSEGISRLCLNRNLSLNSNFENLAYSDEDGRVVLLSGEASAPGFSAKYIQNLRTVLNQRKSELDTWFEESKARMPGSAK